MSGNYARHLRFPKPSIKKSAHLGMTAGNIGDLFSSMKKKKKRKIKKYKNKKLSTHGKATTFLRLQRKDFKFRKWKN